MEFAGKGRCQFLCLRICLMIEACRCSRFGPERWRAERGGRRRWSAEASKARLVAEAMVPEANVSAIARRNGLSPAQLFGWRRQALGSGTLMR